MPFGLHLVLNLLCVRVKNCKVEWEWVGLRPHREPTRVELETLIANGRADVIVVHNYGHGGNGISLAPGTVLHALELLEDKLTNSV